MPTHLPAFLPIADGHALFVHEAGAGAPVLLLAGWGMDSRIWGETMHALAGLGLRAIAADRRGHGRSTDAGAMDYDTLADDLATVIDAIGAPRVTVVAHSGAAGEAIRYVSRHGGGRLQRLVLVGAAGPCVLERDDNPGGVPRAAFAALLEQLAHNLPEWIDANLEAFAPQAHRRALDWVAAIGLDASRPALLAYQRTIAEADLRAEAAALEVPVTLIHGDRDASAPLEASARAYAGLIRAAELLVYEGGAHGLMLTHARRLAADIAARA